MNRGKVGRWLLFSLAFLAVAGFAFAAGTPEAKTVTPAKTGGAGLGYKFVLVSHGSSGDPFHSVVKQGMEDAALVYGVSAEIFFSEGDNAKEVDLMDQAISSKPDGIGISIVDPVAFDDVIKKALDQGIPVIAFNNDDADTPNPRLAYIGASEKKVGYTLGKYMQQFLKRGDHIVIPEEVPGMSYAVNRSAGIIQAMKEIGVNSEELDAGYERAETTRRISAYLLGHPETKGVINVGGLTTEVAGMVVEDLKLQDKVVVGGFDLLPNTGPAIKKGITKAVIDQQPYLQGYFTVVQLAMIKYGKFSAFDIDTGRGIVNAANVDEVLDLVKRRIR
jgi:simple sugar transport system substrate-binding protein